jgi:hypothetical protein
MFINSHNILSPKMSYLGSCFAPAAALFNHSCNPNTAITFSGAILSARALVPIPKSSQLFISYVDNFNPPSVRQAKLKDAYFFTCACPDCSASPPRTLGRVDPPLELLAKLRIEQLEKLESEAAKLMEQAQKGAMSQTRPMFKIETLKKAMNMFYPIKDYPLHRQPYATIRAELANAFMDKQQHVSAFVHQLIMYLDVDPFLYPQPIHPVRVVHKWTLLKLTTQLAVMASSQEGEPRDLEEKYNLDWRIIVVSLYLEMEASVRGSHGIESRFAHRVNEEAVKLHMKKIRSRVDSKPIWDGDPLTVEEVQREWRSLRSIAKDGLEG